MIQCNMLKTIFAFVYEERKLLMCSASNSVKRLYGHTSKASEYESLKCKGISCNIAVFHCWPARHAHGHEDHTLNTDQSKVDD